MVTAILGSTVLVDHRVTVQGILEYLTIPELQVLVARVTQTLNVFAQRGIKQQVNIFIKK